MSRKFLIVLLTIVLPVALLLIFTTCDNGGKGAQMLTGVVRDSVTGEPVAGVEVTFGSSSVTTGSDGAYSFVLGDSSGTVIRSWGTHKDGYEYRYWEEVAVDASQGTTVQVHIDRSGLNTANYSYADLGYLTRKINITVKDSGGTEIPTSWNVFVGVFNSNGGSSGQYLFGYVNGGTNTLDTPTFGSDCLVVAAVKDNTDALQFVAWARQVDLSAATTPLTLTATTGTSVNITADAVDNMGMLTFWTPYGWVGVGEGANEWMFTSSTLSATIYNPYGYDGFWAQMKEDISDPNYDKMLFSSSAVSPIGTSVTLPALDATVGPNAGYVGFSVSYNASTGVLSFPPISGTWGYAIEIREPVTGGYRRHSIVSTSTSIALPQWLRTELAGKTRDVSVMATDGSEVPPLSNMWAEFPPDIKLGFTVPKGADEYVATGVAF
jgi:hypothetical protein